MNIKKGMGGQGVENDYILFILIAVFGIFYYDTFSWLIESWIYNEYYSHGFLVPVISGYFVWSMRKELVNIEKRESREGLALFAAGIMLHGLGVLWAIRFISAISLVVTISGIALFLFGKEFIKKISFPLLFLLFMIPIPFMDIFASRTQVVSAYASANIATFMGLPVNRDGVILYIPAGFFEVGLPCSGLNSIISLLTIGAIFAFVLEGGMLMKFMILTSSIPLAFTGNILRITSVLAVADKYGQEAAMKYFHDFSSILSFSVALMGLFLVGRCFGRLKFKKIFLS